MDVKEISYSNAFPDFATMQKITAAGCRYRQPAAANSDSISGGVVKKPCKDGFHLCACPRRCGRFPIRRIKMPD